MTYKALEIDNANLTIMGVHFSSRKALQKTADAIGSNMFEGFEPTQKTITIIRDYLANKITLAQLVQLAKQKDYAG
ncbi:antitoxin VbhA-like [Candidatus Termititenax aidoneus]|uniref:Antitoxin VbhA-like n=1 Tax=Termititenax aidoneus TaxID=2218524 RepID=A0A388TER3_TERA1|nr:antitoxin VbhA-like [Candidatus Termititenax aidoneus]